MIYLVWHVCMVGAIALTGDLNKAVVFNLAWVGFWFGWLARGRHIK